ncbi:MAG TPA: ABC transporter substrate-binding protein [Aliidongia sp.]|uniref:ABC transporter substrate-binding protein n=1 Tax=Aliidongia sp. TaxID=1914230 RepID=UPI002DDD4B0D|nr:ABC transporter substrate-binding protein [Aliidongia sp.]HEV2673197.1 ABC transporter substrate-binding protein [Aliidongia sp.]
MVARLILAALFLWVADAQAQDMPTLTLGIGDRTGFAPLVLAEKQGLFKKHGADVQVKVIGQQDRLAALTSGVVQGVAATVDTIVVWTGSVRLSQVLVLDRSKGADGVMVRTGIANLQDLKGKTIAAGAPGTPSYYFLAYALIANRMSLKDVKLRTLSPEAAMQAFVAGQVDGASLYEPYMSRVRAQPGTGSLLVSTADFPIVCDTLAFQPDYLSQHKAAVAAVVAGWFDALALIQSDPDKSFLIMGAAAGQSADAFKGAARSVDWIGHKTNQGMMDGVLQDLAHTATEIQVQAGVLRKAPSTSRLVDASFVD